MSGQGDTGNGPTSPLHRPGRHAPTIATALLERLAPDQEAMVGDLLEAYQAGRSRAWYWRQVGIAVAVATARDVREHATRVLVLAPAIGWIVVISVLAVGGRLLTHGAVGEWLLDRLIAARWDALAAGTDTLALAWATYLRPLPAVALAYLIAGWVIARRHPAHAAASVLAFMTTTIAVLALTTSIIAFCGGPSKVPYTLRLVLTMKASILGVAGLLIKTLSILAGGGLGVSRRRRPSRDRDQVENLTSCAR